MKKRRGQTTSEMMIVVALVAVAAIGVVGIFGDNLRGLSSASSESLAGKKNVDPDVSLVTLDSHRTLASFGQNEAAAGSFDKNQPDGMKPTPPGSSGPVDGPGRTSGGIVHAGLGTFHGHFSVSVAPP